jgi:hypothetical protein
MTIDSREKRWLIVSGDGRHVTLGRHTDPTPAEIQRVGQSLDAVGSAGWLVVSEGIYHSDEPIRLLMVRQVTATTGQWEDAERLWHEIRAKGTASH